MPTEIETERLVGRLPRVADVDAMTAIYGHPDVAARLYPDGRPRTSNELRVMIDSDLAHWRAHGFGRLHWVERDSGAIVARCGIHHAIAGGRAELDTHWTVHPDRQRRGYAAEAAEAAVAACFAALGVESVTARARLDNAASQAVARSLGFAYERDVQHLGSAHHLYRRRAVG
jgi:RimJ/RimL family protein N-acetyltransferase